MDKIKIKTFSPMKKDYVLLPAKKMNILQKCFNEISNNFFGRKSL